jgi:hypothetical protein
LRLDPAAALTCSSTETQLPTCCLGRMLCSCPTEDVLDDFLSEEPCLLDRRQLEAFWGLDSVAAAGLCRRVYWALGIPRKAHGGLLRMPDVPGRPGSAEGVEAYVQLVKRCAGHTAYPIP